MPGFLATIARLGALGQVCTVFDVGAHHGRISLRFARQYPVAAIHCFEPDPETFKKLQATMAGQANAKLVNVALAREDAIKTFHRNQFDKTSSLYPRNSSGKRYFRTDYVTIETLEVPARSLDAYCEENRIEHIDIIKLDAQGGEYEIFQGATRMLAAQAIDIIGTEFFLVSHYEGAPTLDAIWPYLSANGYSLYDLFLSEHGEDGQARYGDAIFISDRFRREVLNKLPDEP